jgi:hypothetical protein
LGSENLTIPGEENPDQKSLLCWLFLGLEEIYYETVIKTIQGNTSAQDRKPSRLG